MQENSSPRRNVDRAAETRGALIQAARILFAEKGYAETGTPEIVREAGVTRGALYHHFQDKAALFHAVAAAEAEAVGCEIAAIGDSKRNPIDALLDGADAYFKAMQAPGRVRILLMDGPAILGAQTMQTLDAETGAAELKAGLAAAGIGAPEELDALTEILSVAFDRAALAIASGADATPYRLALRSILEGLAQLVPEPAP
ncbi:MAG: TetR family transcriptional regulator [Alphaproteobacteria bacterium]